ncbi:hypothetical protein CROQUDRAFT_95306 [Cronartium quercuum f. sp. fusiforme G11]|uniref:Membrane insertase YidC/Oxa/ALB C-terminal domain-containing protein n=1 Tax=Cronartium quercuum f. sp. fusiforme G11 TaxID=708437 RepID=A0A9P6NHM1_9BASI|nr:hypothetical protein CROQUDRAFT_95306 [Cronartium quercuum f. sp. fusiforme G11]
MACKLYQPNLFEDDGRFRLATTRTTRDLYTPLTSQLVATRSVLARSYSSSLTRPSSSLKAPRLFGLTATRNLVNRWDTQTSVQSARAFSLWPFWSSSKPKEDPVKELASSPSTAVDASKAAPDVISPGSDLKTAPLDATQLSPSDNHLLLQPSSNPEDVPAALSDAYTSSLSAVQELSQLDLQHGFLASYSSGLIEKCLCHVHDYLALPWFLTIPIVIVSLRTVLIPINIWSMQIGARNMKVKPQIDEQIQVIKELQTKGEQQKAFLKQNELRAMMKSEGFRPLAPLGLPLVQGSLFVSFFWALREMGTHHMLSLTQEGTLWFSDLTVAGPWYGLPLIASGLTLLSVETAAEMGGMKAGQSAKVMWFLRAVIVGTLWLFYDLPSAVFLYWCTNNFFSLLWGTFVRLAPASLKKMMKIPETPKPAPKPEGEKDQPGFMDGFLAMASDGKRPGTLPQAPSASKAGGPTTIRAVRPPPPKIWDEPLKVVTTKTLGAKTVRKSMS